MAWQDDLMQVQQFLADRQAANANDAAAQQQQDASAAMAGSQGYYGGGGGMDIGSIGSLMQLAQQAGGGGGGGGVGGFSGTGPMAGHIVSEHGVSGNARAMSELQRVAQNYPGLWSHVISSYRTRAQQEALYQQYLHGNGNLAAPPGHSEHEKGLAFDISASWLQAHPGAEQMLNRLGGFPVQGEPWHWQPQWTI